MSTQIWITKAVLGEGLRIVRGYADNLVVDAAGEVTITVGNCERIVQPLDISPTLGNVVNIGECRWLEKQPPAIAETTLPPNQIICPIRCTGPANTSPLSLETVHTVIARIWLTLIVH